MQMCGLASIQSGADSLFNLFIIQKVGCKLKCIAIVDTHVLARLISSLQLVVCRLSIQQTPTNFPLFAYCSHTTAVRIKWRLCLFISYAHEMQAKVLFFKTVSLICYASK